MGRIHDADIERAKDQLVGHVSRRAELGPDGNLRRVAAHPRQPVVQQAVPQASLAADPQHTAVVARRADILSGLLGGANDQGGMLLELPASVGQRGAALVADKKTGADELLQRLDAGADR